MGSAICTVFFHNYYGDHERWVRLISEKMTVPFILFYNIVEDSLYNSGDDYKWINDIGKTTSGPFLQKIFVRRSPNQGKDIGGKLVLIDASMHGMDTTRYCIFLHDKNSPHKTQHREWREKLFHIIEPSFADRAIAAFDRDPKIGIIARSNSIINEYDFGRQAFASNNRSILTQLKSTYAISTDDHRYVAGTMFWARTLPLLNFFSQHPPLDVRNQLEKGNVMDDYKGTNTHSWERLLSWIFFAQGYTIKELE
ncbi:MAG TPA: rhamnan synthesis F family protein [Puia sp.]|jgi:hypothetical protein